MCPQVLRLPARAARPCLAHALGSLRRCGRHLPLPVSCISFALCSPPDGSGMVPVVTSVATSASLSLPDGCGTAPVVSSVSPLPSPPPPDGSGTPFFLFLPARTTVPTAAATISTITAASRKNGEHAVPRRSIRVLAQPGSWRGASSAPGKVECAATPVAVASVIAPATLDRSNLLACVIWRAGA